MYPPGKTHQNTLSSTFIHAKFKTTGKWMQGEPTECYIKQEDGEKERRRNGSALQTTWWRPLRTDPSLALSSYLSLPLSLSLMLSFCLALTDLLRGRDQNESPAPSSPLPLLSPLLHQLSASPPSFSLTLSLSHSPSLYSWALGEKKRSRGWGRRWGGGGDMSGEDECLFFRPCGLL